MIPPEFILETSATMIVGILFIVTLAQAMKIPYLASYMFLTVIFGIIPFSISAILVLLDYYEAAKWTCIVGFGLFTFWLLFSAYMQAREEQ
jgi:uncharacterized membrane protein